MVRKQGGLITEVQANENIIDKCLNEIHRVDPNSLADKLFHITIKTEPNEIFIMDGFYFITDDNGNFSSIVSDSSKTPEIRDLRFENNLDECVFCFIY